MNSVYIAVSLEATTLTGLSIYGLRTYCPAVDPLHAIECVCGPHGWVGEEVGGWVRPIFWPFSPAITRREPSTGEGGAWVVEDWE